jgi:hypothetical protein
MNVASEQLLPTFSTVSIFCSVSSPGYSVLGELRPWKRGIHDHSQYMKKHGANRKIYICGERAHNSYIYLSIHYTTIIASSFIFSPSVQAS